MISYFDTSAIVPLVIAEPGTDRCREHWMAAERLLSIRLVHVEARAALVQARRSGRISLAAHRPAVRALEALVAQVDLIEIDDQLVLAAAALAEGHALRACDAVHLAGAMQVSSDDLVVVAGDRALLAAAHAAGLATADIG